MESGLQSAVIRHYRPREKVRQKISHDARSKVPGAPEQIHPEDTVRKSKTPRLYRLERLGILFHILLAGFTELGSAAAQVQSNLAGIPKAE